MSILFKFWGKASHPEQDSPETVGRVILKREIVKKTLDVEAPDYTKIDSDSTALVNEDGTVRVYAIEGTRIELKPRAYTPEEDDAIMRGDTCSLAWAFYGIKWRAWDGNPSYEQMSGTAWEG